MDIVDKILCTCLHQNKWMKWREQEGRRGKKGRKETLFFHVSNNILLLNFFLTTVLSPQGSEVT